MLEASLRRSVGRLLTPVLLMAAGACGQDPPAASGGESGAAGSAVANGGTGAQVAGASNSGGSTTGGSAGAGTAGATGGAAGAAGLVQSGGAAGSSGHGGSGGGVSTGGGSTAGGGGGGSTAGGSSGTGGAGGVVYSTDPATFGGQPRCQGFDVCESFESTDLGALPAGFTLAGYGTRKVGVSTDRAMRGARSLKFQIDAQSAVTAWLTRTGLGALASKHFGRGFFRIEKPAPTEFVHFDLLEATGPYGGHQNAVRYASTGTGVGTAQGNWSFIYNVQPSGNGAGSEFGTEGDRSAHPRVDDWMCLEWSFDAPKQEAQYYLDGSAIQYLHIDTERAEIPVFDSIAVGFGKYQNTGAFLVYLDELAFDGERIGCNN